MAIKRNSPYFALTFLLLLAACSTTTTTDNQNTPTPQVQIIGEMPALPTRSANNAALATHTPTPTPLPSRTPIPTAQQVVVSRVNNEIDPALVTPIASGADLPQLTLTDIDGNVLDLNNFATEGRPLVLNFWSLGCGSCFYEFPLLQEFYEFHGDDQVAIIGINIADFSEETRIVAQQLGITFPMVVDQNAEFFTTFFNGAVVPTTIFVDDKGQVARVAIGPMDAYNINLQLQELGLPPRPES